MGLRPVLILAIVVLLLCADAEARKTSGRRSSGWGLGSRSSSRTTSRPRTSQTRYQQHGSNPNKIGWNVPDSKPIGSNTAAKPSAPVSEHVSKTGATNVQSSYNPSGGYPRQPASNPSYPQGSQSYNPSAGHGYYPSPGQGHNPSVGGYNPPVGGQMPHGQAYNPSLGHGYNPAGGQPYNPVGGQPYNPSFGQPHNPSYGHQSFGHPSYSPSLGQMPQQPIILQQASKGPGIGQLAKEAVVFAGVSAGVNAVANRLIPGGIYGNRGTGGGGGGGEHTPVSHTQITYNNYYNNGTAVNPDPAASVAAPAAPGQPAAVANPPANPAPVNEQAQNSQTNTANNASPPGDAKSGSSNSQDAGQNNPNPLGFITPDSDIKKLTEELFTKDQNNANKYITVNLQSQKKDDSTTDDAPEPLLTVKSEAYEIPTVKAVLALHDNYELDVKTKEIVTSEERKEEDAMLDKFLETDVLKITMKFLAKNGYIPDDEYEFKDSLKRIWFSQFKRIDGDAGSSGFETVYLAEQFDTDIIGLHNWIYYAKQEEEKKLNYLGYIKQLDLGDKASIAKVRSSLNGIVQPVTTLFIGTSPELEMALYTMCFFTRPNNVCPISLGGTEFMIVVNRVNYFGKDILISGYPDI